MKPPLPVLCLVVALALLAACKPSEEAADAPADPATHLDVRNRNAVSIDVYVLDGTRPVRLGRVPPSGSRVFRIPSYLVASARPVRFQIEPSSRPDRVVSETLVVTPGERVILVVPLL